MDAQQLLQCILQAGLLSGAGKAQEAPSLSFNTTPASELAAQLMNQNIFSSLGGIRFTSTPQSLPKSESEEDSPTPSGHIRVSKQRVYGNRRKIDFCQVCQISLANNGNRSQGPRRHILKDHLMKKMYLCPFCDFGSNYDKAHVHSHMKKMHSTKNGAVICVNRNTYQQEEDVWMQMCFGNKENKHATNDSHSPKSPPASGATPSALVQALSTPVMPKVKSETPQTEGPKPRKQKIINRGPMGAKPSSPTPSGDTSFYQGTVEDYYQAILNQALKYKQELEQA